MKKFKKNDLKLEKEVITSLTATDLGSVKGGVKSNASCVGCPPPIPVPESYKPNECPSSKGYNMATCQFTVCTPCLQLSVDVKCYPGLPEKCTDQENCTVFTASMHCA